MSSLPLGISEWTLGMDMTFARIIELKKATPAALTLILTTSMMNPE